MCRVQMENVWCSAAGECKGVVRCRYGGNDGVAVRGIGVTLWTG
jgi:hypothetical protein